MGCSEEQRAGMQGRQAMAAPQWCCALWKCPARLLPFLILSLYGVCCTRQTEGQPGEGGAVTVQGVRPWGMCVRSSRPCHAAVWAQRHPGGGAGRPHHGVSLRGRFWLWGAACLRRSGPCMAIGWMFLPCPDVTKALPSDGRLWGPVCTVRPASSGAG